MKSPLKFSKKTIIFATIFVVLIITPVGLNQYYNFQLQSPEPDSKQETIFVITPGQPVTEIAENLKAKNLIKDAFFFRLLVAQLGIGNSIQAGDFKLSPSMSASEIAELLTHGAIDIWITLPEGLRIEEQAERIEEKLKFGNVESYLFDKKTYIAKAEEGYMFPDTYLIPRDADAEIVVNQLRNTFRSKVENGLFEKNLNRALTNEEVVIMASLIEREAKTKEEKPIIAGIMMNRLNNGMALQIDATVQYAKGYDSAKNTWWPQITREDYRSVNSPYNTYLNQGLPPAPISSPGLDSIEASLNPSDTSFYYYLHDANGQIHYAETLEQHNDNIANFL